MEKIRIWDIPSQIQRSKRQRIPGSGYATLNIGITLLTKMDDAVVLVHGGAAVELLAAGGAGHVLVHVDVHVHHSGSGIPDPDPQH
jgi:hypothetical protein